MIKKKICIVVAIFLLIVLGIIIKLNSSDYTTYNEETKLEKKYVKLKILKVSKESIKVEMVNGNSDTFRYSEKFILRKREFGVWRKVDFGNNSVGFAKCSYELAGNDSIEKTIYWKDYFDKELPKGKYKMKWVDIIEFEIQ